MARSVTFNGITRFRPGGISRVRTDNLVPVGPSTNSVALVGEADGGAPGSDGLVSLRDSARAKELFKSGPLVDAILLAFASSNDENIPGGAGEVVVYKTNAGTQSVAALSGDQALISDTSTGASTTTVLTVTTGGLVIDAYIGYNVDITLAALPGAPVFRRRIVSNTATTLTITPALPAAPVVTNPVVIRNNVINLTSRDYGLHTNSIEVDMDYDGSSGTYQVTVDFENDTQVSESLGARPRMHLMYRGGNNAVAVDTVNTVGTTRTNIALTTGGLVAAAHNGATVVINGEQVKISSNVVGALTLVAPGISAANLASLVTGVSTVAIKSVTNATVQVSGTLGAATGLATTITGVTGDNLSVTFTNGMTIRQLQNAINVNPSYLATVPAYVNPDTTLASILDFTYASQPNIQIQQSLDPTVNSQFLANVYDVVNWFNTTSEHVTAVRSTAFPTSGSHLALASLTDPALLYGAIRGLSTNTTFQAGFDLLLSRPIGYVVPLVDQDLINEGNGSTATFAAVAAQLKDHVVTARGASGLERGGFMGIRATKSAYIVQANAFNDEDIQLVAQNPTILDADNVVRAVYPREFACMAASMRAGVGSPGEPLTNKYINISGLTQDSSWDPTDLTDSADLILNGCLFAEFVPGQGYRWVRDLTTYIKSDNLAFAEGSVRDIVRQVVYILRTSVDRKFTGRKATPANIGAIKDFATSILELLRTQEYIVDSTDPDTLVVTRAYNNLRVSSSGDVVRLNVCIQPCPGINFELSDVFVKIPTQVAA